MLLGFLTPWLLGAESQLLSNVILNHLTAACLRL